MDKNIETTLDVLDGDVLDVEANVVSRRRLGQRLVVHLHSPRTSPGENKQLQVLKYFQEISYQKEGSNASLISFDSKGNSMIIIVGVTEGQKRLASVEIIPHQFRRR